MTREALARRAKKKKKSTAKPRRKRLQNLLESSLIRRVSAEEYRERVRDVYDGPKGAILAACSFLSLHVPLGERLFRERKFDLRGCREILDVGCGAGQIVKHLLKYSDPDARITCFDLSLEMLKRSRSRLKSRRAQHLAADLTRLPFADATFDCVTCGFVLEHLPDARPGLTELARVLAPGGKMLLLTTEDRFSGAWTSRFWHCRTYNRDELFRVCQEAGLRWKQEIWYTRMHKMLRAGGILVEIERVRAS